MKTIKNVFLSIITLIFIIMATAHIIFKLLIQNGFEDIGYLITEYVPLSLIGAVLGSSWDNIWNNPPINIFGVAAYLLAAVCSNWMLKTKKTLLDV